METVDWQKTDSDEGKKLTNNESERILNFSSS